MSSDKKKERNLRIKTIRLLFILLPTHWAILIILSLSQEIIQKNIQRHGLNQENFNLVIYYLCGGVVK